MSQETFEHNAMSAVHASRCLTGALLTVYAHLDLLEATDTVLRDAKAKMTPGAWKKIMESVAKVRAALGQAD